MKLKVLASGSKGNCYILESEKEVLIIEAGVPWKTVFQAIDYKFEKIVGCLVSHEHKDHSKYMQDYIRHGLSVYGYLRAPFTDYADLSEWPMTFGGFEVRQFELHHNVECYGFHIHHKDIGNLVFATDTRYIDYKFNDINHWLIECNYNKEILDKRVDDGFNPVLADRILEDHMSLDTCKNLFIANDLSKTKNIVLLHLSDSNSNAKQFHDEIHVLTRKPVYIADKGLEIDLSLVPF